MRFVANPNSKCGQKSKSERHYLTEDINEIVFKKVAPQGRDCPSPPRPRAPPCRDFSPPLQLLFILIFQDWAGSVHMGAPGSTPGREDAAGWTGSRTLLPVDKDSDAGGDSPQGWLENLVPASCVVKIFQSIHG